MQNSNLANVLNIFKECEDCGSIHILCHIEQILEKLITKAKIQIILHRPLHLSICVERRRLIMVLLYEIYVS